MPFNLFRKMSNAISYALPLGAMFGSSLPQVACRGAHVLFALFVFLCVWWCPACVVLCFWFVLLRLVYPMFPVSLDCPVFIDPSVFSNFYYKSIKLKTKNTSFSEQFQTQIYTFYKKENKTINTVYTLIFEIACHILLH